MTQKEFNKSLAEHYPFLFEKAFFFTRDHQNALDLVQETILKSLSNFHNYDCQTNLKGWLYIVLRNTFINIYHKNKQERPFKYDLELAKYAADDSYGLGIRKVESKLIMEDIFKYIKILPKEYLQPFIMHYKGYKYTEISEKTNIPLGTVKTRIHKARTIIKKKLSNFRHDS